MIRNHVFQGIAIQGIAIQGKRAPRLQMYKNKANAMWRTREY
jgi:hypothetical protein